MKNRGNEFKGWKGGVFYEFWKQFFGFNNKFYTKGLKNIDIYSGMDILDLGCGTGGLCFALNKAVIDDINVVGIDISKKQLFYARNKAQAKSLKFNFAEMSIDKLFFRNESFDIVMTSMVLHETPVSVRHKAIAEASRILKKNGYFLLIDWSKPRFGLWGIIWLPILLIRRRNSDNWYNRYPKLCEEQGMQIIEDEYINSLVRRQIFIKK